MAHQTTLILFAGLLTALASNARQTQPPQPMQPIPQAQAGCSGSAPQAKPAPNPIHVSVPPWLQRAINKQRAKLSQQTGVDVDPNTLNNAVKDAQTPHPCPAQRHPPAVQPAPVSANTFTNAVASRPAQTSLAGMWESSSPDGAGCMLALNAVEDRQGDVTGLVSLECSSPQEGRTVTDATVKGRKEPSTGAAALATVETLGAQGHDPRGCRVSLLISPGGGDRIVAAWHQMPPCGGAGQAELRRIAVPAHPASQAVPVAAAR